MQGFLTETYKWQWNFLVGTFLLSSFLCWTTISSSYMPRIFAFGTQQEKESFQNYLKTSQYPPNMNKNQKSNLRNKAKQFRLINDQLYVLKQNRWLRFIHLPFEADIAKTEIDNIHRADHCGMTKLWLEVNKRFYGISQEMVYSLVGSCEACIRNAPLKQVDRINFIRASRPMERIIIDLVDLRMYSNENSGYCWLLVAIDSFSKYAFYRKLKSKTATDVLESLVSLFETIGYPTILHSDNGKEFKNNRMIAFAQQHGIQLKRGRARHPPITRTSGTIEPNPLSPCLESIAFCFSQALGWCYWYCGY